MGQLLNATSRIYTFGKDYSFLASGSRIKRHVLERPAKVVVSKDAPAGMRILYALIDEPNALIHEREFDTHQTIALQPGMYEFRIGREFDPYEEIARRQAD